MGRFEKWNEKLNAEWAELSKQFAKAGNTTAKETAGAAAEVLKGLAKELGVLGEKLEKWVKQS